MKTTKTVEYGILLLRSLNTAKATTLATVTAKHNISLHFMEQVARKLRVAGIIKSLRGPGGGYVRVSNQPISFLDVEKAVTNETQEVSAVIKPFMTQVNETLAVMAI